LGASKVIAAQAEVESAKLMRAAADILNSPAAMQIRYLDTLKTMSGQSGTKVIFMPPSFAEVGGPLPNDSNSPVVPPSINKRGGDKPSGVDFTNATLLDVVANY
jgi:hypothetical protein